MPLYIRDGLGYTEGSAGVILFFRCLTGLAGFTILARFTLWHFRRRWFFILQGGLIICSILYLFAGSKLGFFFLIAGIYGLIGSGCNTTSIFYSSSTGKNTKKNLALHEIFSSLGQGVGSAGGGFLYQHFRYTGMCVSLTIVLSMGIGIFILLDRRKPLAPTQPDNP
jgi:predicted MFS family arabinose efflux permease